MSFFFGNTAQSMSQPVPTEPLQNVEETKEVQYRHSAEVVLLPIGEIAPNQNQPRKYYSQQGIEELALSISQNGLLQPITVRRSTNKEDERPFELVAGHRRLLAVSCLGMEYIEAIIQEMNTHSSAIMAMVENLQRADLSFFEEASAMAELVTKWGMSQQDIATRLGKSQPTVANKLRLLRLPPAVKNVISQNNLSERHARAILRLQNERDMQLAVMLVVRRELNVQQTEKYIDSLVTPQSKGQTKILVLKDYRLFLNSVKKAVDTMASAGIEVDAQKTEDEEFIHYNITIPKSKVLRAQSTTQE